MTGARRPPSDSGSPVIAPFGASNAAGTCLWCGARISRPWLKDDPFCTLRCGYFFGRRLAALGRRLKPTPLEKEETP